MTEWTQPAFIEVDMSAEIGGYQGDDPTRQEGPDFLNTEADAETP